MKYMYESQPLVEILLSEKKHTTGLILHMHVVCEITLLIRNVILVNIGCVSDIIFIVRIYPSFANSTYTSQSSMFL